MAECVNCGSETKYNYRLCWRCHVEERVAQSRHAGYEEGYRAGYREGSESVGKLDTKRVRQLLQLCHPDRHAGSTTAVEVTQWLLSQRRLTP